MNELFTNGNLLKIMKKRISFWRTSYSYNTKINELDSHTSPRVHTDIGELKKEKKKRQSLVLLCFRCEIKTLCDIFSPKPNQSLHICVKRVFFRKKKTTHYHPPNPTELINLV